MRTKPCSVCDHAERADVERALALGVSVRRLTRYHFPELPRHVLKRHLRDHKTLEELEREAS